MDFRDKNILRRVDTTVGQNLKSFRASRELSQQRLAEKLGITFQQVQKYENGTNRISASRLYALSHLFRVPLPTFFDGVNHHEPFPLVSHPKPEDYKMALRINAIKNANIREKIIDLINAVTSTNG